MKSVRGEALSLLLLAEEKDGFANLLLSDSAIRRAGEEAPLLTALFYGTVERRLTLDYAIGVLGARDTDSLTPHTRNLLRLGLYQIYFMRTPAHAATDMTVALGSDRGEKALVNAIMRRAADTPMPLPPEGRTARYLSVKYSFPLPTVRTFLSLYGKEETEALFGAFNRVSPLTLTVNLGKKTRDELISSLADASFSAQRTRYAKRSVRLDTSVSPERLPGFFAGDFLVQDEASSLAAEALGAKEGDLIVDVCAAPGGKILSAATSVRGIGEFYAFDLHESKLSLIRDSAERLGVRVTVEACDATKGREALFGRADRVICDVPCSGLGVLGKKPDLRYRERSEALAPLGLSILRTSAGYVKEGGVLLYSTCTLLPEENEENVMLFLKENSDFVLEDFAFEGGLKSENGMLTLYPHKHGTDGFFMAKLVKKKSTNHKDDGII